MTDSRARGLAIALGLGLALALLGASRGVQAQAHASDDRQKAARLLDEGVARFGAGKFEAALALFQAAFEKYPSPKIYLNLGEVLRKLGRNAAAAEAYDRFLVDTAGAPEVSAEKRSRAQTALDALIRKLGRLHLDAQLASATVTIDGQPFKPRPGRPIFVAPGPHQLSASAAGYSVTTISVTVAAGEEKSVQLSLTAVPSSSPVVTPLPEPQERRGLLWTWVAGGATVGLAVGGIVTGVKAQSAWQDYQRQDYTTCKGDAACLQRTWQQRKTNVEDYSLTTTALFCVAGAAAVGTALIYWFLERPHRTEARLALTPAGAGVLGLGLVGRY